MNDAINRRRFLASAAALPLATLSRPDRTSTVDGATGERLDALYEALRATWGPEIRAVKAYDEVDRRLADMPEGPEQEALYEELGDLFNDVHDAARPRRNAYFDLLHAVLEAAGKEDASIGDWYSYGKPIACVKVRNRLYVVAVDSDADYDADSKTGFCAVTVIDLDGTGGTP